MNENRFCWPLSDDWQTLAEGLTDFVGAIGEESVRSEGCG